MSEKYAPETKIFEEVFFLVKGSRKVYKGMVSEIDHLTNKVRIIIFKPDRYVMGRKWLTIGTDVFRSRHAVDQYLLLEGCKPAIDAYGDLLKEKSSKEA